MSRMRILTSFVAVGVVVAGLAGCSGDDSDPVRPSADVTSEASGSTAAEPSTPTAIKAGDKYVALGDSYTSGPRIARASGHPGCRQSVGNYPHRLAKTLRLDLVDVSCGSAKVHNLAFSQGTGSGRVPPQYDALTADTKLVTLGIGGNEDALFGTVVVTCVRLGSSKPGGRPCGEFVDGRAARLTKVFDRLEKGIETAIGEIRTRSPEARVIVVGYPSIIPASGRCDALPLATADYDVARQLFVRVNAAVKAGAAAADAEYADLGPATKGHDICGKEPWIAGATVDPARRGFLFHPYAEEQAAAAVVLRKRLAGTP